MPDRDRERDAFLLGEQDFYEGIPIGDCPYPMSINDPEADLFVHWCDGWRHGQARAARLTLELELHPIYADNAAERALVRWVIDSRDDVRAEQEASQQGRRFH